MKYLKSLFPFRWMLIVLLIGLTEALLFCFPILPPHSYHVGVIVTYFMLDICFGIGRSARDLTANIVGFFYLVGLILILISEASKYPI